MTREEVSSVFRRQMSGFPRAKSERLAKHLLRLAERHNFDPAFLLALMFVESSFRVKVVSNKGAVGLMQVLPTTATYVARRWRIRYRHARELRNPYVNMTIGVRYLAFLRDRFKGDPVLFLAAYNSGPARVDRAIARNSGRPRVARKYVRKVRKNVPMILGLVQRMIRDGRT